MGALDAYNMVTQLAAFPCAQPTPVMYATTFLPAVAPALIEFVSFGCRDILKFRLGISAPCGRIIKGQFKKASPPKLWDFAQGLMKFERAFSTAGFWFMIADLASDTTIRWSTLAYRMADCSIANQQASWQWEPFFEDVLFPGVPKPVAGAITNYNGEPGHATIIGAVCPANWYCNIYFNVEYRPFPGEQPGTVQFWIREVGVPGFDFPATSYGGAGWFGGHSSGGSSQHLQNHAGGVRSYEMWAMADNITIISGAKGNASVSALPPMDLYLSPLNCWRDALAEVVPDPLGRNRKTKPANVLSPIFNAVTPKPVRGRPGGMPRSKK